MVKAALERKMPQSTTTTETIKKGKGLSTGPEKVNLLITRADKVKEIFDQIEQDQRDEESRFRETTSLVFTV